MVLGASAMAQQKIQLRSTNKAECVKSDMTSLKASFSFSTIEAQDYESERGTFSWLSLPNTVIGGNEGDPQIPVVNELMAVPFGANPRIEITSYSTTDYRLEDFGIHTLVPRQPSVRKDQRPEDVPFIMNEAAYQSTRGFRSEPMAIVNVVGTMRGVQLGKMTIEPVSYDPVNNTLRVFNDIEVTVYFDGADAQATEQMLVDTYSPYFDGIYGMLFNGRAVRDAYSDHPDLYTTPVKMLVVTTSTYVSSTPFQTWLNWKKQKGIDVDVQTVTSSTSSADVRSLIQSRYNANHPSFLVIVGDESAVTYYTTYTVSGLNYNPYVSDLQYASIDNDVYHDMFMSRMSVSSTTELGYLVDKIMMYEQYTMPDPSYLSNVLLIAGADSNWAPKVGRPTINYAADNYFNTEHGFTNVYKYVTDSYTGCYNYLSSGVGFANYTAHGDIQEWYSPNFTNDNVNALTNTNKYFWAMGNCCLTCNFGNSSYYPCYGEAMIRAQNKGAFGYIGSVPESYWYEDYYFGVGATNTMSQTPTMSQTTTGVYDFMFDDTQMNTLNSVPFAGNVAVTYAHANGYQSSVTDEYYWRAYQCFGDGSVMPYHTQPAANNVSHASTIGIGMTSFVVNADAGSYVAITKNNEILGVAQVPANGSVEVPVTGLNSAGDVMIVVTRQQRQPYIQTIQAVSLDGPYVTVDSYTPNTAHVGDDTNLSITFKNVGADATTGTTTVTLTPGDSNVSVVSGTQTQNFGSLAANATTTVSGFKFNINSGVADGTIVKLHYTAVNGSDTWEGNLNITAGEAVLEYQNMVWDGGFVPDETLTLTVKFKNTGHYQATNAQATMTSTSNYITINNSPITVGTIGVDEEVTCQFTVTIAANCPETGVIPVTFTLTADGGLTAQGNETLKNSCNVIFDLHDSYSGNDGWNGATLIVSFDDGTPSENLTIENGSNSATYTLEIGNGTHVTLTWSSGSYDGECSFTVSYEGDLLIYSQTSRPSAGVLFEFDCNCAAATAVYNVNVTSSNTAHGTVSGGGEFSFGESCTVTATPAEGYMFTNWTMNGEIVSSTATYTFIVISDMDLVANFAEGNMIGDGGDAASVYLPSYNYFDYSLSQQIYTAAEFGSAGLITSIAFYNGGEEKTRTYDFYMKATDKSTFSSSTDWVTVTEDDKVFSGQVTMVAGDWTFITFTNPFLFDGTSNVVLVTDDNTGGFSNSPHMQCRVFEASSQAIRASRDNTDYNPFAPSGYSGTVMDVKNQLMFTKEPLSGCVRPLNLDVNNITHSAATVTWDGYTESYLAQLGLIQTTTLVDEDFSNAIPSSWTNDANYPWTIVDGHMQSGNAGVASSTSSISLTVNFTTDGTISFDFWSRGEGTDSQDYDNSRFYIDNQQQFRYGAHSNWESYSTEITAGTHTFKWEYKKDSSVNSDGDCFIVDNVVIISGGVTWNNPVAVEDVEYTFSGLTPETNYCVRVQGVCDNTVTEWSGTVVFTTDEATTIDQTVSLPAGCSWWSTYLDITLEQLEEALGTAGISITSHGDGYVVNNSGNWSGSLQSITPSKMYKVQLDEEATITLSGVPVTPADYPITLYNGSNWIGYPVTQSMSLSEAFAGANPVNGDVVSAYNGSAMYYNGTWYGSLQTLEPGCGYIYKSNATEPKTFQYPSPEE